jgi:hypothetical protein
VHDFYSFAQDHVVVWMSPLHHTMMGSNHQDEPLLVDACITDATCPHHREPIILFRVCFCKDHGLLLAVLAPPSSPRAKLTFPCTVSVVPPFLFQPVLSHFLVKFSPLPLELLTMLI